MKDYKEFDTLLMNHINYLEANKTRVLRAPLVSMMENSLTGGEFLEYLNKNTKTGVAGAVDRRLKYFKDKKILSYENKKGWRVIK